MLSQGLSQVAPLRQSRTAIGIVPLRNGQGKKKHERKHKRRVLFQYRNCKLKQNVKSIFYRTFKVPSRVTFQSRSDAIFVGNLTGLLIFRVVAEPRNSQKHEKYREIQQKSYQIHVCTTYLKVISAIGAIYLP